ncbi:unnamed protein product [marine sediment metagenome]|uniref:RNA polymerase sigma-70 region 2 domain-containing protein n=1 Tax=marine sediment metagenome TaxID=412755 RepID=X0S9F5_9ZZZZ
MNLLMKRKKKGEHTYEDFSDIIDEAIQKQKYRWRLNAVRWFDFEDVSQIIKLHISKKWHMWDQERPLEPWIGRIISNQIRNLVRNHYGNYVKPCANCEFALGEACSITPTKKQDTTCTLYSKWVKSKKSGLELKTPLSTEDFPKEVQGRPYEDFDFDFSLKKLDFYMEVKLSGNHYVAYRMLYFEDKTEEDVARFMGYKISPQKSKLGYRQVKNLKKKFLEIALEILKEQDIIGNEPE